MPGFLCQVSRPRQEFLSRGPHAMMDWRSVHHTPVVLSFLRMIVKADCQEFCEVRWVTKLLAVLVVIDTIASITVQFYIGKIVQ